MNGPYRDVIGILRPHIHGNMGNDHLLKALWASFAFIMSSPRFWSFKHSDRTQEDIDLSVVVVTIVTNPHFKR
jgi:hypothetical protein